MARMSVDDSFLRDPRVAALAARCEWSVRETRGALLDVWAVCYDRTSAMLSVGEVNLIAGRADFVKHLIDREIDLGRMHRSGKVVIAGVEKRIGYLIEKSRAGRQGGLKSRCAQKKDANHSDGGCLSTPASTPQALLPSSVPDLVPDSASVPDGVLKKEGSVSAALTPPGFPESVSAASLAVGNPAAVPRPRAAADAIVAQSASHGGLKRSRKAAVDPTDAERASVRVVLDKLGAYNGVAYSCSDGHTKLIVRQLRAGVTEEDLRKIVWHRGPMWGRDSENFEKMGDYLRPETIFGPETISKYLDPARAAYAKHLEERKGARPPTSSLVQRIVNGERGEGGVS